MKVGVGSRKVENEYMKLLEAIGNEFTNLMDAPLDEIEKASSPHLREAISKVRSGEVSIVPGFDGEYGKIKIFERS
jgi:PHP family Zn ribbon phosphoesterase